MLTEILFIGGAIFLAFLIGATVLYNAKGRSGAAIFFPILLIGGFAFLMSPLLGLVIALIGFLVAVGMPAKRT